MAGEGPPATSVAHAAAIFEAIEVKAANGVLGRKADVMTRCSLHPVPRETIEAEAWVRQAF